MSKGITRSSMVEFIQLQKYGDLGQKLGNLQVLIWGMMMGMAVYKLTTSTQ